MTIVPRVPLPIRPVTKIAERTASLDFSQDSGGIE